jgi:hypothetical protein
LFGHSEGEGEIDFGRLEALLHRVSYIPLYYHTDSVSDTLRNEPLQDEIRTCHTSTHTHPIGILHYHTDRASETWS